MICVEARALVGAYQDGELNSDQRAEVGAHLHSCAECAALLSRNLKLSEAIRTQLPTYSAPASLVEEFGPVQPRQWTLSGFVGGLGVGLAFAAGIFLVMLRPNRGFGAELVDDHVRSLMAGHLVDVPSTDRHEVKPWFLGKLDFAPSVPNLDADGFPLIGGRLDYIGGHAAAAIAYRRARHIINVIVMPEAEGSKAPSDLNGYHVRHWQIGNLGYWAVSDVAEADLSAFETLYVRRS
jgi:anti-sigma factor RsiW